MPLDLSQLRMGFRRFETLEPPVLPPGYSLRTFRPGDEDAWIGILNTGDFGVWDRDRLDWMLAGTLDPLTLDGVFFATRNDAPVGAVCLFLQSGEHHDQAGLGWVAVMPPHRGHGLGAQMCRAALAFAREHGHTYAFLKTEDFRLAALRTYLCVGFEPEMQDETQPLRWDIIREAVGLW